MPEIDDLTEMKFQGWMIDRMTRLDMSRDDCIYSLQSMIETNGESVLSELVPNELIERVLAELKRYQDRVRCTAKQGRGDGY